MQRVKLREIRKKSSMPHDNSLIHSLSMLDLIGCTREARLYCFVFRDRLGRRGLAIVVDVHTAEHTEARETAREVK